MGKLILDVRDLGKPSQPAHSGNSCQMPGGMGGWLGGGGG